MNVWGVGSFDNDSAAQFVQEVVEDGLCALQEAFEVALDPDLDELEFEEGARVIAAAEVLAAALNNDTTRVEDSDLEEWIATLHPTAPSPFRALAQEALARVLGPHSELPEYWEEDDLAPQWRAEVQRLQATLS